MTPLPRITQIPTSEEEQFKKLIQSMRKEHVRSSKEIATDLFTNNKEISKFLQQRKVSDAIHMMRNSVYDAFLIEEAKFNELVMKEITRKLSTPSKILDYLITTNIANKKDTELENAIKQTCGEYAGRIYPFIYALSLSNTNSRRSRSGATFEACIYKIYELLKYPYDSQKKVGSKIFSDVGLGKKVDSILPGLEAFKELRTKVIIGTMKTSLRERWQEVAEEIERTKVPQIHLLTVDEAISKSKANEMKKHNITIVALEKIANSVTLKDMRNIISFEEYFFEEIPNLLEYWNKSK